MLPCNDCRPLILDHLYGLLDAAEAATVEAHLAGCPACASARAEAAKMQGLIAKAAKGAFPSVRFDAPAAKPARAAAQPAARPSVLSPASAAQSRGAAPAIRGRSAGVAMWVSWAVAATVLVAVPGTVVPVVSALNRAETARHEADEHAAKTDEAADNLRRAVQEADKHKSDRRLALAAARQGPELVLSQWMEDEKSAVAMQRGSGVRVLKPVAVQPGAPNEFLLVIRDRDAVPTGRVLAEVRDQTDAVIYSQSIETGNRHDHTVRLPADVWTKLNPKSELFLSVASVDDKSGRKTELQERVRLLGPVYTTVLTTDKPTYRPGETVHFRSLTLDRVNFTPPPREQLFRYDLENHRGETVHAGIVVGGTELVRSTTEGPAEPVRGPDGKPLRGVGAGEIVVPSEAVDGDYTLVLHELPHPTGHPPAVPFPVRRSLRVQSGAAEVYHKEVGYAAASYTAGETVEALAQLKLRGKPVAGVEVHAVATADDRVLDVFAIRPTTDTDGTARLRFVLPPELERGDVRLKVTFRTRAGDESVAERVPVVGRNVVVEFFPEGGELVAGVPCRVYFRATTPGGLPVDVTGVVTDGRKVLADVQTVRDDAAPGANRGIGSFTFTPELGTPVWLKLSAPATAYAPMLVPNGRQFAVGPAALAGCPAVIASRTGFVLPEPAKTGVVMHVLNPVTAPGEAVRVHLYSVARARNLVVGAYTRGRLSDTQKVSLASGQVTEVRLMGGDDPRGGVVRVTVFEEPPEVQGRPAADLKPVAERLVYRKPGDLLNLDLAANGVPADGAAFAAGSPVTLGITATTDSQKKTPAAAVLYAAVVNSAATSARKDHLLTTHFLIAGEVSTPDAMEYADFLLGDHPRAAESLDLVLATQGWRRFAEQTPKGFAQRPFAPTMEQANLMVCNGQNAVWTESAGAKEHRRLFETYWPRYEAAVKKLEAVRAAAEAAEADKTDETVAQELEAKLAAARAEQAAMAARAEQAAEPVARFRGAGWYAVAGFGLLALLLGAASLVRPAGRLPLGIGTVGSLGLVVFLVFALMTADRTHAAVGGTDQPTVRADQSPTIDQAPAPRESVRAEMGVTQPAGPGREPPTSRPGGKGGSRGKGDESFPPGRGGFGGGGGGGFFPGSPPPPKFPGPAKFEPKYPPPGVPGLGGFPPSGGSEPPTMKPDSQGADAASSPALPFWPLPTPWFPQFPLKPAAPDGTPLAVGMPGAAKPKDVFLYKFAPGDGWQPGRRKLVSDKELDESKVLNWLRDQTKENRVQMVAPAPPGGGVGGLAGGVAPKLTVSTGVAAGGPLTVDRGGTGAAQVADTKAFDKTQLLRFLEAEKLMRERLDADLADKLARVREKLPAVPEAGYGKGQFTQLPPDVLALDRIRSTVPQVTPLVVREYAAPRPGATGGGRGGADPDTILWQPVIVLPADGKATLSFDLGGAKGGYQVVVAGHTLDGRIGAVRAIIPVSRPESNTTPSPVPPGGSDKR